MKGLKHEVTFSEMKNAFLSLEEIYRENYHILYNGLENYYKKEYPDCKLLAFSCRSLKFYDKEPEIEYYIIKDGSIKKTYEEDEVIHAHYNFRSEVYIELSKDTQISFDLLGVITSFATQNYEILSRKNSYFVEPKIMNKSIDVDINLNTSSLTTHSVKMQRDFLFDRDIDSIFADWDWKGGFNYLYVRNTNYRNDYDRFNKLKTFLNNYNTRFKEDKIFDKYGHLKPMYYQTSLKDIDLSDIDFSKKCLAGIDVSDNIGNVTICFEKIQKDVHDANFRGYHLKGYKLSEFNIIDTDLRETSATIDLASCNYSYPGKMKQGTLFDENNTFYLGEQKISLEQVESMGIKVYRKGEK